MARPPAGREAPRGRQAAPRRRLARLPAAAILALVAALLYANTLGNGFVDDDEAQVLRNPWIQDVRRLPEIFTTSVWSFLPDSVSNYYRPLMHVVYMAAFHLFGLAPWGFHLVSLLFHAASTVMVFFLAARLPAPRGGPPALAATGAASESGWWLSTPFLAGLIFATHPIHTEAVAWIASVPEVAYSFFFLLSLSGYMASRRPFDVRHVGSVAAFFVALLFKETALTLPIALVGFDLAFPRSARPPSDRLRLMAPYLAAACVYLLLRYQALSHALVVASHPHGLGPWLLLVNVFPLFADYLAALLLPVPLNFWHSFHPVTSLLSARSIVSLLATALFALCLAIAWRKDRVLFFALLLVAVPLLPALYIEALPGKPFAERYLYLPSAGFAIAAAGLLAGWLPGRRALRIALTLGPVIVLYAAGTWARNGVWKDPVTLFSDTVARSPDAATPRYDLAIALFNRGRVDEALEHYRLLVAADPLDAKFHSALGGALLAKSRLDESIEQLSQALALQPRSLETLNDLGIALKRKGLGVEAMARYREALSIDAGYADAHFNLGVALAEANLTDEALLHLRSAARLKPDNAWYRNMLGIECARRGLRDEAIAQFEAAIRLAPEEPAYRVNLEKAAALGR